METTVAVGLGLGLAGLGLRLVKVPEHFGWGLLAAGAIIVAWGLAPGAKPSGWQLALYVIGVAAIASAAAWQISDAMKRAAVEGVPARKVQDLRKLGDLPIEVIPQQEAKSDEAANPFPGTAAPGARPQAKADPAPPDKKIAPAGPSVAVVNDIDGFIQDGRAIQAAFMVSDDAAQVRADQIEWSNKVEDYLRKNVGPGRATQFAITDANPMDGQPAGRSDAGGYHWAKILAKNRLLAQIMVEAEK